jgi:excinuclease UvrABC nuclease subunit
MDPLTLLGCSEEIAFEDIRLCGVYLLYLNGEVVYVGQSVNVYSRLDAHLPSKTGCLTSTPEKRFDAVRVIRCEENSLRELELRLIAIFEPALNGPRDKAVARARYGEAVYG